MDLQTVALSVPTHGNILTGFRSIYMTDYCFIKKKKQTISNSKLLLEFISQ